MNSYNVVKYTDGQIVGSAKLSDEQFRSYERMSQSPEGVVRLGSLLNCSFDIDCQGVSEDTIVYLD